MDFFNKNVCVNYLRRLHLGSDLRRKGARDHPGVQHWVWGVPGGVCGCAFGADAVGTCADGRILGGEGRRGRE